MKLITISSLLLLTLFLSCKKDTPSSPEATGDFLTKAQWINTTQEFLENGAWKTKTPYLDATYFTFRQDNSFKVDYKPTGETFYHTWKLSSDGKTLEMKPYFSAVTITILTKDKLQFTTPSKYQGEPDERFTFVHP